MEWLFEKEKWKGCRWKNGEEISAPVLLAAENLHAEIEGEEGPVDFQQAGLTAQGSFELAGEDILSFTVVLHNSGKESIQLADLYLDIPATGVYTDRGTIFYDADDYYISHPIQNCGGSSLLVMPYGETQLELCEARCEDGVYRCYLYAQKRKKQTCYEGVVWRNPSRALVLPAGKSAQWQFFLAVSANSQETASYLMRLGRVPNTLEAGVNGTRTISYRFSKDPLLLDTFRELTNASHSAVLKNGRLSSLRRTKGSVEVFDSKVAFGDVEVRTEDGRRLCTAEELASNCGKNGLSFSKDGLLVSIRFQLKGEKLLYRLSVENTGDSAAVIEDLRVPFPINNRMDWGVNAAERMLRHSQVAGDNSFFLCTPCDGKGPYMLFLPEEGTRLEFFELTEREERYKGVYSAYIYGSGAALHARQQDGGRWRLPTSTCSLGPGEKKEFGFTFQWVENYEEARRVLIREGKIDVQAVPGLTVPRDHAARLLLRGAYDNIELAAEHPENTEIRLVSHEGESFLYEVKFHRLGENLLTLRYGDGREGYLEMFSTLPVAELLERRSDYIRRCQILDEEKWYNGLLRERNTKTGALLDPDHYDEIEGWRIYEVTCDDPGLSKPAFLAAKNADIPNEAEIRALDDYIEHFVWGGLQRKDTDDYPYAIYGIPDWYTLRNRKNLNATDLLHVWRVYDYPHIALMYLKMYEIARNNPQIPMKLSATEYLQRAYGTYLAMYQYPMEIEQSYEWTDGYWSPYVTGFYNELAIADAIDALRREGMEVKARRLEYHWHHKTEFFIRENKDLFGSEYSFDTTGFESTQAIVDWGRKHACGLYSSEGGSVYTYTASQVEAFDQYQRSCNIACRGFVENAYYITGSDIRGDSTRYTLGYMAQMGGWALLQDALYSSESPFELLRLAYTSLMSTWAILNAGDEESNYGYWFPGKENDGATSGGFEAAPYGKTWLGQNHQRGAWIYGCETDLGHCGYLRGASVILAADPDFGETLYGGLMEEKDGERHIIPTDGVARRFHIIASQDDRIHVELYSAHMKDIRLAKDGSIRISLRDVSPAYAHAVVSTHSGEDKISVNGMKGTEVKYVLHDDSELCIRIEKAE